MIQNAVKNATPTSEPQRAPSNVPYKIKILIAEKIKARSTRQRTQTPDNKGKYNQISNTLKSKLRELRNETFKAYISSLKREYSSIWKPIKNRRKPTESQTPIPKNTTHPEPWAKSDKEKADLFAEHLSEVFTPHNNDQNQEVEQELEIPIHQQDRLKPFTLKEIKNEIKKLNHKKAPGIDLITATMLKELPQKALQNLQHILHAIIRLEFWPKALKQSQILMIPKPWENPIDVNF